MIWDVRSIDECRQRQAKVKWRKFCGIKLYWILFFERRYLRNIILNSKNQYCDYTMCYIKMTTTFIEHLYFSSFCLWAVHFMGIVCSVRGITQPCITSKMLATICVLHLLLALPPPPFERRPNVCAVQPPVVKRSPASVLGLIASLGKAVLMTVALRPNVWLTAQRSPPFIC